MNNLFDQTYELSDYEEDYQSLFEPDFSVEPDWWMEIDIRSNCIDGGEM